MIEFVPSAKEVSEMFSQAIAPTFFFCTIAGFVSLMSSRLAAVMQRIQNLNAIAETDPDRAHLRGGS